MLNILRDEFYIWTEVEGTHFSGRRLRLDAVVTPKNTATWKTPHVAIGIESGRFWTLTRTFGSR